MRLSLVSPFRNSLHFLKIWLPFLVDQYVPAWWLGFGAMKGHIFHTGKVCYKFALSTGVPCNKSTGCSSNLPRLIRGKSNSKEDPEKIQGAKTSCCCSGRRRATEYCPSTHYPGSADSYQAKARSNSSSIVNRSSCYPSGTI